MPAHSIGDSLPIGALARHTGVKVETIRYYERIGLLADPPRSAGGHRVYGCEARRRLTFIRRSRDLGFSLDEVRALLAMVSGDFTCGEVRRRTLAHLEAVRRKRVELERLESRLTNIAARCEHPQDHRCPVVEELFDD